MIGTIPPGVVVPLHSHDDPETFIPISGQIQGLAYRSDDDFEWVTVQTGDIFHVPSGAKHGFKNTRQQPAALIRGAGASSSPRLTRRTVLPALSHVGYSTADAAPEPFREASA